MSTLKAIKTEVLTKAATPEVGAVTWQKKVQTFFIGLFVVLLGVGTCVVGGWLLIHEKGGGLWVGLVGVVIAVGGATIWDAELVTGSFKSLGSWLGGLIGGVVRGVRGQADTPPPPEPPANG